MVQGWHNDDYLILFQEQSESVNLAGLYDLANYLPGYSLVGIKGWDNFIVCTAANQFFTVPTVPMDMRYLEPLDFVVDFMKLRADERFVDKIKWYIKPIVFGGDAHDEGNIAWLSLNQHTDAVKWWNQLYFDAIRNKPTA